MIIKFEREEVVKILQTHLLTTLNLVMVDIESTSAYGDFEFTVTDKVAPTDKEPDSPLDLDKKEK